MEIETPKQSLMLYACGSDLIVDYIEVCLKNGVEIRLIIDNLPGRALHSHDALECVPLAACDFTRAQVPFLVPLFSPRNRFIASREALGKGLTPFGLLSDRNNDLPLQFTHGAGCFVNKRVVVGAHSRIGDYVVVNRGACLGHHLVLEDYVSIGPGVVTGGGVTLRTGVLAGVGAIILPGVTVGAHAIVGAGAVVAKDVADYSVVMGDPARHVRENENAF